MSCIRQDEMVCAFFGAMGVAILISVPWMETCDFDVQQDKVNMMLLRIIVVYGS